MKYFVILLAILIVPMVNAQEYKLKYVYYPRDILIEYGKSNQTLIYIENLHNETLYDVKLNFILPQEFYVNFTIIDELEYKQKKPIKLNITTFAKNGIYEITSWAESIETETGVKVQSQKYNFTVNVFGYSGTTISTTTITTTEVLINTTLPNYTNTIQEINKEERTKKMFFIIPALITIILIGFIIFSK